MAHMLLQKDHAFYADNKKPWHYEDTKNRITVTDEIPTVIRALELMINAFDPYGTGADAHNNHGIALYMARKALAKAEGRKE